MVKMPTYSLSMDIAEHWFDTWAKGYPHRQRAGVDGLGELIARLIKDCKSGEFIETNGVRVQSHVEEGLDEVAVYFLAKWWC
jgi:hypothetical protein